MENKSLFPKWYIFLHSLLEKNIKSDFQITETIFQQEKRKTYDINNLRFCSNSVII